MRILGFIIAGAIGIAALRLVIIALVLANLVALIISIGRKPAETFGLLVTFVLLALIGGR